MVNMFHDLIHKFVEVYIDDILAKSKKKENHLEDLRVIFERYNLKLNPKKMYF